jgi:hypothetical protein
LPTLQLGLAGLGNHKLLLPGIWPSIGLKINLQQYLHAKGQDEEEFQIEFYLRYNEIFQIYFVNHLIVSIWSLVPS